MCQARPDANLRYFLDFVRTAVVVIAVFANALTTDSQADETTGDSATDKQSKSANDDKRVIIADSNIPTAEEVGDSPVFSMNRDLIEKSGERQTAELLRDLPFANANGIPVSNNANGFTPGAASVSLRGFTPEATLVLIDGRRIAPYPISDAGGRTFQDLFSIQLSAVQSIEILKDGAFITSGANAVAGVVNFRFWKDYRGTQVTLDYGNTLDKDSAIYQSDVLFGVGDDYVNITGDIFFYHHDSLFNRDRGNSATPAFRSPNSSPFNLQLADAVVVAAGGSPASPGNPVGFAHAPFFSNGLAPAKQYVYTADRSSLFNFNQFSGCYPEQERYGGYAAFNDKICEDQVQLYGDFYYAKVKTNNELVCCNSCSFTMTDLF
jgi:iron complex outermembrane recepter protein